MVIDGLHTVVNTRFSCLCMLDGQRIFVPRWKPSFTTGYDPSDRCHFNGRAGIDDAVEYVNAEGDNLRPGLLNWPSCEGSVLLATNSLTFSETRGTLRIEGTRSVLF